MSLRRRSIIITRIGRKSSTPCRATWPARRGQRWKISSAASTRWAQDFADVVTADRFVTDLTDQDALNKVWGEFFRDAKPTTTTVQVVRLATDPRCLVEINAIAVID